jgi:hypothetical protein
VKIELSDESIQDLLQMVDIAVKAGGITLVHKAKNILDAIEEGSKQERRENES